MNVPRSLLILDLWCQTIPRNVLRQMKGIVDSNSRDENIIKGCQELRTRLKNWTDENQFKLISKRQRLRNNDPSVFNFLAELGKLWSKKWWIIISAYWVAGPSQATNCQAARLWRWCWYWEETSLCSGDKFSPDCDGGEGGGGCIVTGNILYIVSPRTSPLFISQWALQSQTLRKTLGLVARWDVDTAECCCSYCCRQDNEGWWGLKVPRLTGSEVILSGWSGQCNNITARNSSPSGHNSHYHQTISRGVNHVNNSQLLV